MQLFCEYAIIFSWSRNTSSAADPSGLISFNVYSGTRFPYSFIMGGPTLIQVTQNPLPCLMPSKQAIELFEVMLLSYGDVITDVLVGRELGGTLGRVTYGIVFFSWTIQGKARAAWWCTESCWCAEALDDTHPSATPTTHAPFTSFLRGWKRPAVERGPLVLLRCQAIVW